MPWNRGLSNQRSVAATSSSNGIMSGLLLEAEVEVRGQAGAVRGEGAEIAGDALAGGPQIVEVEVDVEEVDVPGGLPRAPHVRRDDRARDRQRRRLGVVVDVAVAGRQKLGELLVEQAGEERRGERVARLDSGFAVLLGEGGALVQPLPEDAGPDLAGRHVLHEVGDVVVAEEVGRLEGGG